MAMGTEVFPYYFHRDYLYGILKSEIKFKVKSKKEKVERLEEKNHATARRRNESLICVVPLSDIIQELLTFEKPKHQTMPHSKYDRRKFLRSATAATSAAGLFSMLPGS